MIIFIAIPLFFIYPTIFFFNIFEGGMKPSKAAVMAIIHTVIFYGTLIILSLLMVYGVKYLC